MLLLKSLKHRGFVKLLTCAKFFYNAGLLEFSLEFFESSLNVLALFNRYYNHFLSLFLVYIISYYAKCGAKIVTIFLLTKLFRYFLLFNEKSRVFYKELAIIFNLCLMALAGIALWTVKF